MVPGRSPLVQQTYVAVRIKQKTGKARKNLEEGWDKSVIIARKLAGNVTAGSA